MGVKFYLRDEATNELLPAGVVASGANDSLKEIKEYAEKQIEKVKNSLPEDYTEVLEKVDGMQDDLSNLNSRLTESIDESLRYIRDITQTEDINSVKKVGCYYVPVSVTITNLPDGLLSSQGYLVVIGQNGNSPKTQMYFNIKNAHWYTRPFISAQWGVWSCEYDDTSLRYNRMVTVTEDMNDMKAVGCYNVPYSTNIKNLPDGLKSTSGYLMVIGQNGNSPKTQMYYNNISGLWYTREFISAQWGTWKSPLDAIKDKLPTKVMIPVHQVQPIVFDGEKFIFPYVVRLYVDGSQIECGGFQVSLPDTFVSGMCLVYNKNTSECEVVKYNVAADDKYYLIAYLIFDAAKTLSTQSTPNLIGVRSFADIDYSYSSPLMLNVCSYNIGLYNYGADGRYSHEDIQQRIANMKEFFANNFDFMCLQESSIYIDSAETINADSALLDGAFPYNYRGSFYLTISSKYPLIEKSTGYFASKYDGNQRGYIRATALINKRRVVIFSCHPAWQPEAVETRKAQMQEIIAMFENEERVILCGDWNVATQEEFNTLINAGYKPMNGGYLPFKRTYNYNQNYTQNADTTQDRFFDNILVKGNVTGFRKVHEVYEDLISDHIPISARITLY